MTARTDNSDSGRYSPAYATGRVSKPVRPKMSRQGDERGAADIAAVGLGDGVRTCTAAKLARALGMDFFPELREKTGAEGE